MRMRHLSLAAVAAVFTLMLSAIPARAQTVLTEAQASKTLAFRNLTISGSTVTGMIENQSPHTIRDVELLVQYHWLWENEFNPGQNPPGKAAYFKLDREIEPGESVPFSYDPTPALSPEKDGRFMPEVSVAGFTVVVPQNMSMGPATGR